MAGRATHIQHPPAAGLLADKGHVLLRQRFEAAPGFAGGIVKLDVIVALCRIDPLQLLGTGRIADIGQAAVPAAHQLMALEREERHEHRGLAMVAGHGLRLLAGAFPLILMPISYWFQ